MKLKHVFFSSLLLSTAFVACTNEDIENLQTEAKGTLALGEGYTINVSKGVDSRAAFDESKLTPYWEEDDKIGAAWFHEVTALDPNDNSLVAYNGCGEISTPRKFRSNHPFELIDGEGTGRGEFESVTNAFAGAYVFYYPYDESISKTDGYLDVTSVSQKQTMDCTPGKEWDAVNANMFAYGVAGLVPGGPTADEFVLNQVPVLYRLRFSFTDKIFLNLTKGMSITKVIVEAKKDGETVLTTTGKILPPSGDISYTDYNNGTLPAAEYQPGITVDHLSINIENSDNSDYQITALKTPTEKPFIFSALPFSSEADKVTFKIVTSNGYVFAKTIETTEGLALINGTEKNPGAAYQGGQVVASVALDTQEQDKVAYTEEQFMEKWYAAQTEDGDKVIEYGENLVLNENLVFNNVDEDEIVVIKAHCDKHSLTINGLNVEDGNVVFEDALVVKGNVVSSAEGNLTAKKLSAKNITANGYATLNVVSADLLTVAASGDVTLSTEINASGVANIVVNKAAKVLGDLRINEAIVKNMTNNGHVYVNENVSASGTIVNNSTFELVDDFTNNGTFQQNGVLDGDAKFINDANAVLNLNVVNEGVAYVNNAATAAKKTPGTINVYAGASADNGNRVVLGSGSVNNGIINVVKGWAQVAGAATLQNASSTGIINVSEDATLRCSNTTSIEGGRVNMLSIDSDIQQVNAAYVYFATSNIEDNNWSTGVPAYNVANNLVVDTKVVVNSDAKESVLEGHRLHLEADLDLPRDLELSYRMIVSGTSTIKGTNETQAELKLANAQNKIVNGGALTLINVDVIGRLPVETGGSISVGKDASVDNAATPNDVVLSVSTEEIVTVK